MIVLTATEIGIISASKIFNLIDPISNNSTSDSKIFFSFKYCKLCLEGLRIEATVLSYR